MNYIWTLKPYPKNGWEACQHAFAHVDVALQRLLCERSIHSLQDAYTFFNPKISHLHPPLSMKNMDRAVTLLQKHIALKNTVVIIGDYDVDGTTATTLLYEFLEGEGLKVHYYIPDRNIEGYGLSMHAMDFALHVKASLVMVVDCGTNAVLVQEQLLKKGLDVLICDHHEDLSANERSPKVCLLNPKQKDCQYAFDSLTACGVAFKLVQAYYECMERPLSSLWNSLDLVGLSIAADIASVLGENRVLLLLGIKRLQAYPRLGLWTMMGPKFFQYQSLQTRDLVFKIVPRINAVGRVLHAKYAVEWLLCKNEQWAKELSFLLNEKNQHRKMLQQQAYTMAIDEIEEAEGKREATVLWNEKWHKGVLGIVASKCMEHYPRPTMIAQVEGEHAVASLRAPQGINLISCLDEVADQLETYGGHERAAGLRIKKRYLSDFKERFINVVRERYGTYTPRRTFLYDAVFLPQFIEEHFLNTIRKMRPFGPENMRPVFRLDACELYDIHWYIEKRLLKVKIKHDDFKHNIFEGIAFGMRERLDILEDKSNVAILFSLDEDVCFGQKIIKIDVKDMR